MLFVLDLIIIKKKNKVANQTKHRNAATKN